MISIHVNSSKNVKASGISIWILSKKYINLKNNNISKKFLKTKTPPHVQLISSKYSTYSFQKIEYNLAKKIIKELKHVNILNNKNPKYARFGILQSHKFPSILIETGFISNPLEEKQLSNKYYQNKIAKFIFIGLKKFFLHKH